MGKRVASFMVLNVASVQVSAIRLATTHIDANTRTHTHTHSDAHTHTDTDTDTHSTISTCNNFAIKNKNKHV